LAKTIHSEAAFACRQVDPASRAQLVPDWLVLTHGSIADYNNAAMALRGAGPDAFEPLVEALRSPQPYERAVAVIALQDFTNRIDTVVPLLLERLEDSEVSVRGNAVLALGALRAQPGKAVPALVARLDDPSSVVRQVAINALQNFREQTNLIVPVLIKKLDDPDWMVRFGATNELRRLDPAALDRALENR
jgi:HEAT repeat protein